MLKRVFTIVFFAVFLFKVCLPVYSSQSEDELRRQIEDLNNKISIAKSQQKTLSTEITVINSQIEITKIEIDSTEQSLGRLSDDIATVSGKIIRLEEALAEYSNILTHRIIRTYTAGRGDPLVYLIGAGNFQDFLGRLDYLRIAQKHDKKLMIEMAVSRKNYNDQKDSLENRKKEKEVLSSKLKVLQTSLDAQNRGKQKLLAETQGDESRYQQLLSQAQAQLAAFNGFVINQGGAGLLSGQTKCDDWGCYYNQRDSSWGAMPLNHTGYTLADSGCLVTSMAMVISHYGKRDVNPVSINNNSNNFASYFPAFLNKYIVANGSGWNRPSPSLSQSEMDNELSAGRPVIVQISLGKNDSHFVVIVSGSNGDYIMKDPYIENGNNISFTSKYPIGSIVTREKVIPG